MTQQAQERRIDQFFSGPGARADEWRDLVDAAKAWSGGSGDRAAFEAEWRKLRRPSDAFIREPVLRGLMASMDQKEISDSALGLEGEIRSGFFAAYDAAA